MAQVGELLSDSEVRVIVQRSRGVQTFDHVDVHIEPWSSDVTGYCSKHLRVTIAVKLRSGEDSLQKFFAKCIPYSKDLKPRELQEYLQFFHSEFVFFSQILPAFGVDVDSFSPRCLYAREDLLVMEDLSQEDFSPFAARDLMSYDDCVATLQSLARMHAASLAFEEQQPEHKTVLDLWPDIFTTETASLGDVDDWLLTGVRTLEFLVDIVPEIEDKETLKYRLTENRKHIINIYNGLRKVSSRYRNVLSHGDIWSSNLLVKRSPVGHQVDVKLIDFQLMRYAPLAYDVTFFIHQVSDRNFRKQYQDSLLSTYYKALAECLTKYHLDVETIQTFNEFLESCNLMKPHAIIGAALYHPHTLLDAMCLKEIFSSQQKIFEFMNLDRNEYVMKSFNNDELYRLRICDTYYEYIDWFCNQVVNKDEP